MSFGLKTWGADRAPQLDENSFTLRVVLSTVVNFGGVREVKTFVAPECTPDNANAFVIPVGVYTENDRQFEVVMGHGVVEVANWVRQWTVGTHTASGAMRLIVMRHR